MNTENKITVYTDGACANNPGPGGWAIVIKAGYHYFSYSAGEAKTTNNRMELKALLYSLKVTAKPDILIQNALKVNKAGAIDHNQANSAAELEITEMALPQGIDKMTPPSRAENEKIVRLHINSDSMYLINGATKWLEGWKKKGWIKADKKPLLNLDLWQELDLWLAGRVIDWSWVKGHSQDLLNDECDRLAKAALQKYG